MRTLIVIFIASLIFSLNTGCETTGRGTEASAVAGAVVIFSHLASSAQNGDKSAKTAWCRAFEVVHAAAQVPSNSEPKETETEFVERLVPEIHNIMRETGYQMHHQQLAIVIKDALHISNNAEAAKETISSCAPPSI